ncbi:MAG: metallophosphoesterase [Acidobacteriota bacterium]|nr:metallophosphoesterase [Acidobacteriota bacterium]
MRTVVHLSDVHFGRVDYQLVEPLVKFVNELTPHVVVVSGDLTQRARAEQFREARAFLDRLPKPQVVVPGNHDVPLYNLFARFLTPLDNYRRYISDDLAPFYMDDEIAIVGINTARSLTFKGGRINEEQVALIRERMCALKEGMTKIVVTHHPFDVPEGGDEDALLGRAEMAMQTLARCGADVLLAGHIHLSHIGHTASRYRIEGHSALVIQAGTATSTRGRGEANSFNVIRVEHPGIEVERVTWQPETGRFTASQTERFRHTPIGWTRLADAPPTVEETIAIVAQEVAVPDEVAPDESP